VRGKEKERESFLSSVSWVERKREVKRRRRRRGSMVSLKRGGEAMEDRERGWCWVLSTVCDGGLYLYAMKR
jgi:hypothetical protein